MEKQQENRELTEQILKSGKKQRMIYPGTQQQKVLTDEQQLMLFVKTVRIFLVKKMTNTKFLDFKPVIAI